MIMGINKESVELTFVYLLEGCGKTQSKINDTIPHTRIDMGYRGTENVPFHRYLYESECCPYRLLLLKTSTFSNKDLRKTLSQYVMTIRFTDYHCKCKNFSFTNNTHRGIAKMNKKSKTTNCLGCLAVPLSRGRDSETLRDSGTVQMSHSSVTGVRSKSLIRLWISGKYSLENHFSSKISMSLLSLSCIFRGVPGMSSPFCFH